MGLPSFRRKLLATVLMAFVMGLPAIAYADDSTSTSGSPQTIPTSQSDTEDVTPQQIDTQNKLDAAISKQNAVAGKINSLDKHINTIQKQVDDAQNAYNAANAAYQTAHNDYLARKAKASASTQRVREQAADLVSGRTITDSAQANLILSASSVQDLQRRRVIFGVVANYHKKVLDQALEAKKLAQQSNDAAQSALTVAQQKRDEIAKSEGELQDQRAVLATLNYQQIGIAASQASLLSQQEGQKVDYLSRIKELDQESSSISSLLQGQPLQAGSAPGKLAWPLDQLVITSPFGPRVHPVYGDIRMHTGDDFRGASGTPIKAADDGTVVFSGTMNGYGNVIIINHGGGIATLYAHQSVRYSQVGDQVKTGEIIGLIGMTGDATGPHLHFEVRVNGTPVNPLPYLGISG